MLYFWNIIPKFMKIKPEHLIELIKKAMTMVMIKDNRKMNILPKNVKDLALQMTARRSSVVALAFVIGVALGMLGSRLGMAPLMMAHNDEEQHSRSPEVLEMFRGTPSLKVTSKLANRMEGATEWCTELLHEMEKGVYREHRKQWEFCFMAHALDHYGKLKEGSKGIGFAVGTEPLAPFFVKRGAELVVSDLPISNSTKGLVQGWANTGQHAAALNATFTEGVVDYELYAKKAKFIPINMNEIPGDLLHGEYDFVYSSSSLEHVGSVELGRKFILNAMKALKKGGVGVHTTEFAINSLEDPGKFGHMSVWLKKDVDLLESELEKNGCKLLPVEYAIDKVVVDELPYSHFNHFILRLENTIHTSIAFVIEKVA